MIKWRFLLVAIILAVSVTAAFIVIYNLAVGDLEARNFDIAVMVETGEVLSCTMTITETELVNGTYPPVAWSGSSDSDGRIQGWLKPGNYGAALSCTDGRNEAQAMPMRMSVNFWGRARVQTWDGWADARRLVLEFPPIGNNLHSNEECICSEPTTPEPTPYFPDGTPTPVTWPEGTPTPTEVPSNSII